MLLGRVTVTELASGAFVVSATGALDGRSAGALSDALIPLAGDNRALVVLDLTDAHGLDDDTLDVIARAAEMLRLRDGYLLVVCPSRSIEDQIHERGLGAAVSLHPTPPEAVL